MKGITAKEAVRAITQHPDFHYRTLQSIGDEVGVTREYVRQLIRSLGLRKAKARDEHPWLRLIPDEVLLSAGKAAGSATQLAQVWATTRCVIQQEFNRRGLSTRSMHPIATWRWLKVNDPDEYRRRNTIRCREYSQRNRERTNAIARAWRARNPEKSAEVQKRYYEKHRQRILEHQRESRARRRARLRTPS